MNDNREPRNDTDREIYANAVPQEGKPVFFTDQYKRTMAFCKLRNGAFACLPLTSRQFKGIAAQHVIETTGKPPTKRG